MDLLDYPSIRVVRSRPLLKKLAIPQDNAEKVVEIMGNATCQLTYGIHLLGLPDLFVHLFRVHVCGSVTNIALDYVHTVRPVHVADELDVDAAPISAFKRQIVISDITVLLQFSKRCL
jgi:hypothetical protein